MLCAALAQALLASSHLYHEVKKNAESHGVIVDGVRMDLGKMMAQKETAVAGLTKGVEGLFKKYKARFPDTGALRMPSSSLTVCVRACAVCAGVPLCAWK